MTDSILSYIIQVRIIGAFRLLVYLRHIPSSISSSPMHFDAFLHRYFALNISSAPWYVLP